MVLQLPDEQALHFGLQSVWLRPPQWPVSFSTSALQAPACWNMAGSHSPPETCWVWETRS